MTVLAFDRRFQSQGDGDIHEMRDENQNAGQPVPLAPRHRRPRRHRPAFPSAWPRTGRAVGGPLPGHANRDDHTYTLNPALPGGRCRACPWPPAWTWPCSTPPCAATDLAPLGLAGSKWSQEFSDDTGLGWNLGSPCNSPTGSTSVSAGAARSTSAQTAGPVSAAPGNAARLFPATAVAPTRTLPEQLSLGCPGSYDRGAGGGDRRPLGGLVRLRRTGKRTAWTSRWPAPARTWSRDWDDTWSYSIGGRYALSDRVALLAGYKYGNTPVPDSTFEPAIPDADTHLWTVGADLQLGAATVSLSYGFQHYTDRTWPTRSVSIPARRGSPKRTRPMAFTSLEIHLWPQSRLPVLVRPVGSGRGPDGRSLFPAEKNQGRAMAGARATAARRARCPADRSPAPFSDGVACITCSLSTEP